MDKNNRNDRIFTAIIAITAVISLIVSIISVNQTWNIINYQTTPKADLFVSNVARTFPNIFCEVSPYSTRGTISFPKALNEDLNLYIRFANIGFVPVNVYYIQLNSNCMGGVGYIIPIPENTKLVVGVGEDIETNYAINSTNFINKTSCQFNITVLSNAGENLCSFSLLKGQ
jgi:hypothetical protein